VVERRTAGERALSSWAAGSRRGRVRVRHSFKE
jgi:hypothetical protein